MIEIFVHRNGDPKVEKISASELPAALKDERSIVWVDMECPTGADEKQILADIFDFHPLTIEDCQLNHSQPKIEEFPNYLYFIVHGVRDGDKEGRQHFESKELDGYLGKNFVVTYHHDSFKSIASVKRQISASPSSCQRGAAYLLHQILDLMIDNYTPVLENLDGYMTKLEDSIFESKKNDNRMLAEIMRLKRSVTDMRRISSKQLNVLYRMSHGEFDLINQQMLPFYRDVYDHLLRISDLSETYRDMTSALMETYLSVQSNRMNEVMKTLTIFSAIMLPLTVITGIYGMNFENMPELKTRNGYFVVLGVMATAITTLFLKFRRKGWL
jgi:magnesium transporter